MNKLIRMLFAALVFIASSNCTLKAAPPPPVRAELLVTTEPGGALIACDGLTKGNAPITVQNIEPGEHLITATLPGHAESRRTVSVIAGQRLPIAIRLEPVTGLVLVETTPPGAEVKVNGADRGKTPMLITDLPLGTHRIKLTIPGFAPREIDLNIKDRIPTSIKTSLASDSAKLDITSEPVGARVTLNGADKGVTPCVVDRIPAGDNTVELTHKGFYPFKQTIKIVPGTDERLQAVLKPIPSGLTVVSIPSKARVYVENQFRGETPLELSDVEGGTVRVRAELSGYETVARTITIERGKKVVEEFRLEKNSGALEIVTEPAGVKITVDGQDAGVTLAKKSETDRSSQPLLIDFLSAGEHTVKLTRPGCAPKEFPVQIERDKTTARTEKLEERFAVNYEVRTFSGIVQGALKEIDESGNIRIEVKPGIVRTIKKGDIISHNKLAD